ncbi:MAG: mechanosensitive ion channel [Spartobacteria bacterium]|nr:mechanosensitive ion channel [Spartobacteria bacterium]
MSDLTLSTWIKLKHLTGLFGIRLILALAILILGLYMAKWVRSALEKWMRRRRIEETLVTFLGNLSYLTCISFVIISALTKFGIPATSFIALLTTAGIAVAMGLKDSLSNFSSGILLLFLKYFKVGDYIQAGGVGGIVEELTLFTTVLRTPDNKRVIVPNAKLTGDNMTNFSTKDTRRIDLTYSVSYDADIDHVKQVLRHIVDEDARILKDPEVKIGFMEFASSSLNFVVRPWVKSTDYWDVLFAINERVKKEFDKQGIEIPYPQQDVHVMDNKSN